MQMSDICSVVACHVTEEESDTRVESCRNFAMFVTLIFTPLRNALLCVCADRQPIYMHLFDNAITRTNESLKLIFIHASRNKAMNSLHAVFR